MKVLDSRKIISCNKRNEISLRTEAPKNEFIAESWSAFSYISIVRSGYVKRYRYYEIYFLDIESRRRRKRLSGSFAFSRAPNKRPTTFCEFKAMPSYLSAWEVWKF